MKRKPFLPVLVTLGLMILLLTGCYTSAFAPNTQNPDPSGISKPGDSGQEDPADPPDTLPEDTEAPVIITENIDVTQGRAVSYKSHIRVTDNLDPNPTIQVDNSSVDLTTPGTYSVTYTVTDWAGNVATSTVTLTVWPANPDATEENVMKMANQVLDGIIDDGMTDLRKAYMIYRWMRLNMGYTGSSDKTDWLIGAYDGLKNMRGDCYNFYAVAKALLTAAGIENVDVVKTRTEDGANRHYWLLVNTGDGWYHFDATPFVFENANFFMLTDGEIFAWDETYYPGTHTYDPTGLPTVATESLKSKVAEAMKG